MILAQCNHPMETRVCVCVRARSRDVYLCVNVLTRVHPYTCSIKIRGHNLVWSVDQFVQDWVKQLWGDDLRSAVRSHIAETVHKMQGL